MSNKIKLILSTVAVLAPGIAFGVSVQQLATNLSAPLNSILKLLFAVAFVWFIYGVFSFVASGGDEKKRTEARNTIIYGLVVLFVMSAAWGLVGVIKDTLGLGESQTISPPTVNVQ